MKQRTAPALMLAALAVLAVLAVLAACENYNQSLKPEIEYNGSVEPAHNETDLRALINAIPPGGSGTVTVMESFALGAPVQIVDRAVTVEAYSGTATVAVLFRGAGFDGSFFEVQSGASLSLRGGREKGTLVLDGGGADADAPLVIVTGGELTLGDQAILRNNTRTATGSNGGGVSVTAGSFIMTGGSITGNTRTATGAGNYGGGVSVSGGIFRMSGGTIAGNASGYGGGVSVSGGIFRMSGGTIAGNTSGYGGGVIVSSGSFALSGGTITGNTANTIGGGVSALGGSFTMSGGVITGNRAVTGGGGVHVEGGDFTMSGGDIVGNTADGASGGGGVYVSGNSAGSFSKSGGTIAGNTAANGLAVSTSSGKKRDADAGPSITLYAWFYGGGGSGWTYQGGGLGDTTGNWDP
jgi:hypothetical protein